MRTGRTTLLLLVSAACLLGCAVHDVHPIRSRDSGPGPSGDTMAADAAALPDLTASWAESVPYANPVAIAAHPGAGGDLVVAGFFSTAVPIRFGEIELSSAGSFDIFVVRYDSSGRVRWARRYGAGGDDRPGDVAMDAAGNVALTGYFSGSVSFGGQSLSSQGGVDLFVLKLDAAGEVTWARSYGGGESDMGGAITFGRDGLVVAGEFFGSANFAGVDVTSVGDLDVVLISLDGTGQPRWTRRYGGPERERVSGLGADGAGNVALVGTFNDTADFGGVPLTSAGSQDAFVARVDAQGAITWTHGFGGMENDGIDGPLFEPGGDLWVTGNFAGTISFVGEELTSEPGSNIFLARLSPAGELVRVTQYGALGLYDGGLGLALDGRGGLIATGIFRETIRFGPSELVGQGFNDIFLAQIDAQGEPRWAAQLSGSGEDYPAGVAVAAGQIYLAGRYDGPATFGETIFGDEMGFPMFVLALPLP